MTITKTKAIRQPTLTTTKPQTKNTIKTITIKKKNNNHKKHIKATRKQTTTKNKNKQSKKQHPPPQKKKKKKTAKLVLKTKTHTKEHTKIPTNRASALGRCKDCSALMRSRASVIWGSSEPPRWWPRFSFFFPCVLVFSLFWCVCFFFFFKKILFSLFW